jgi:hypothetical protein
MQFILDIKQLIQSARKKTFLAINTVMIETYWEIGRRIVEEEQNGFKITNRIKSQSKNLSSTHVQL